MLSGRQQAMCKLPVIREEKQSFRIFVEPADREEIPAHGLLPRRSRTVLCFLSSVAVSTPAGLFII
jgi:hypothetical protein